MSPEQQRAIALANARRRMAQASNQEPEQPAQPEGRPEIKGGRGIGGQLKKQSDFDYKEELKAAIPAYQGNPSELREIGAAPELNELSLKSLKSSLAANLIGSDFELAQSLQEQLPGTSFTRDDDANLIATLPSGGSYYLNAPGLSGQDAIKFATRAGLFALTGGNPAGASAGTLAKLAASSAATEAGAQGAEAALGGDFDGDSVAIAAAAAPAGQAITKGVSNIAANRTAQKALNDAAPSIGMLKGRARDIYNQIDELGVTISEKPLQGLSKDIATTMKRSGFNAKIHPKVAAALDEISTQTSRPLSVSEVDTLRKVARSAARSIEPDEARLGSVMVEKIDDFLDKAPRDAFSKSGDQVGKLFREARGYWSKAKKSELINDAVERAQNQASGFENGLRSQFRSLLNNPKKMRGFSNQEKEAIKLVVRGGTAENMAKALGKFGFTEGQATSMLLGSLGVAGGAALGGGAGAVAVPLVGQISKGLAQRLTRNNARFADQVIRAGADGKKIALAYIKNTPASQRSTEELTELLMRDGVNLSGLKSSANKLFNDAAFFANAIRQGATTEGSALVAEEVQDGVNNHLQQKQAANR